MASKKKESHLQTVISNQEEWNEMLKSDGLTVIDVHQAWCGPCKAVLALFKKLRSDVEDDILHFAVAAADNIESLQIFRGKSEPIFLFCAGGKVVSIVRGANAPLLNRMVIAKLEEEKKVLEGLMDRSEVKEVKLQPEETEEPVERPPTEEQMAAVIADVPYIIAVIKPNAVADGKIENIKEKIQTAGHIIKAEEIMTLTEEEIRNIYQESTEEVDVDELVKVMSDGPFCVVIISQGRKPTKRVSDLKELTEPVKEDTEPEKEATESLPAVIELMDTETPDTEPQRKLGLQDIIIPDEMIKICYSEDNKEEAIRLQAAFFKKIYKEDEIKQVEQTLAIVRPILLKENKDGILEKIKQNGYLIEMQRELILTEDQAHEFYKQQKEQDFFPNFIEHMTSGPILVLALSRINAVQHWKQILGPKDVQEAKQTGASLRAEFAVDDTLVNQLHGSSSLHRAMEELEFFFPVEQTFAIIKPDAFKEHKDDIMHRIKEAGFTVSYMKEINLTPEMAAQFYKNHEEKPYFNELVDYMSGGPSVVMALSKRNAVEEWRNLMGPTDPEEAKLSSPNSLRAQFAKSTLENAVHGSSNTKHAIESIELFFKEITAEEGQTTARGEDKLISEAEEQPTEGERDQVTGAEDESVISEEAQPVPAKEEQLVAAEQHLPDIMEEDQSAITEEKPDVADVDQHADTGEEQPAVADEEQPAVADEEQPAVADEEQPADEG